ncbi:DUF6412 domain-containing protein [Kribbella sp. NBC_01245]|uniref:DUF6412 domain-containing protein n=1 Tax=Kribbella sp. NBC_01245 TaxID=2903578 RepID=UPI002E281B7D|nr:DUF6412 domain-containing protein [Kribbella sp. NBC_01245]
MGQVIAGVWSLAMPALGLDSGLLAVAVLTAAASLFALLLVSRAAADQLVSAPQQVLATALREVSRESAFLRLRDPDDAGRPRPRAPGQPSSSR